MRLTQSGGTRAAVQTASRIICVSQLREASGLRVSLAPLCLRSSRSSLNRRGAGIRRRRYVFLRAAAGLSGHSRVPGQVAAEDGHTPEASFFKQALNRIHAVKNLTPRTRRPQRWGEDKFLISKTGASFSDDFSEQVLCIPLRTSRPLREAIKLSSAWIRLNNLPPGSRACYSDTA